MHSTISGLLQRKCTKYFCRKLISVMWVFNNLLIIKISTQLLKFNMKQTKRSSYSKDKLGSFLFVVKPVSQEFSYAPLQMALCCMFWKTATMPLFQKITTVTYCYYHVLLRIPYNLLDNYVFVSKVYMSTSGYLVLTVYCDFLVLTTSYILHP